MIPTQNKNYSSYDTSVIQFYQWITGHIEKTPHQWVMANLNCKPKTMPNSLKKSADFLYNQIDKIAFKKCGGQVKGRLKKIRVLEAGQGGQWHEHCLIQAGGAISDPEILCKTLDTLWSRDKVAGRYSKIAIYQPNYPGQDYALYISHKLARSQANAKNNIFNIVLDIE